MQLYPIEFEILSGLVSTSQRPCSVQPMDVPGLVITILPEGHKMLTVSNTGEVPIKHGEGFLFGDRAHDWNVRDGKFYFFSHDLAPAGSGPAAAAAAQKADVLVVYKWLEIDMSTDGDAQGRSTIKAVRHGFPMSVDISKMKKPGSPQWEATFSQPSLGRVSMTVAEDLGRAQLTMVELANKELARRMQNVIGMEDEALSAQAPAA